MNPSNAIPGHDLAAIVVRSSVVSFAGNKGRSSVQYCPLDCTSHVSKNSNLIHSSASRIQNRPSRDGSESFFLPSVGVPRISIQGRDRSRRRGGKKPRKEGGEEGAEAGKVAEAGNGRGGIRWKRPPGSRRSSSFG